VLGQLGDPREGVCALELAWEKVTEGLSIARYPVTNAQYRLFVEEGGYQNPAYWPEAIEVGDWKDGTAGHLWGESRTSPVYWDDPMWNVLNHPVVGVNWYEAVAYCHWLTEKLRALGTLGEGVVRLPTEAEWQQAAQGEDGREYPWGRWQEGRANTRESGIEQTSAVGLFPEGASPGGALDMAGNVWEWCADWYDRDRKYKVLRGGSWYYSQWFADCSYRFRINPRGRLNYVGFRCARGSL
jgi:formylglycine-generating enzyme required for sulfatase activity